MESIAECTGTLQQYVVDAQRCRLDFLNVCARTYTSNAHLTHQNKSYMYSTINIHENIECCPVSQNKQYPIIDICFCSISCCISSNPIEIALFSKTRTTGVTDKNHRIYTAKTEGIHNRTMSKHIPEQILHHSATRSEQMTIKGHRNDYMRKKHHDQETL